MKISLFSIWAIAALQVLMGGSALAQSTGHDISLEINETESIAVSPDNPLSLSIAPPAFPGEKPGEPNDNSKRILYTVITPEGVLKKIVGFLNLSAPGGTALRVEARDLGVGSEGDKGRSTGDVELTTSGAEIIRDIGSCITGDYGFNLNYSFVIEDLSAIRALPSSLPIQVTYTLTTQ